MKTNKYRLLVSNTAIFAIGNLLVKLISFFLMPLYTTVLTTEQYGVAELLNSTVEIVLPIATLSIVEALYRFSIDSEADHETLFVNSTVIVLLGDISIILISAILFWVFDYQYAFEFGLLFVTTTLYRLTTQFARGLGHAKRFALYGVINALLLVGANCVLLLKMNGGIKAYLLSFSIGYGISGLIAFIISKEYLFLHLKKYDTKTQKAMLKYSLPGIPNMLSWWVNSVSDRYIIMLFWGSGVAGLYTAASKLPAMINIISSIFQQAWQYSTAKEINKNDNKSFFSNVFDAYSFVCVTFCSILIVFNKIICHFLLKSEFYSAWKFVPLLLVAACFGCYSSYFGTFYNALKNNKMLMISTILGAIVNIILNFVLIPFIGGIGAAIATLTSYLIIVVIRIIDVRRIVPLSIDYVKWGIQVFILISEGLFAALINSIISYFICAICSLIIILLDYSLIRKMISLVYKKFKSFVRKSV